MKGLDVFWGGLAPAFCHSSRSELLRSRLLPTLTVMPCYTSIQVLVAELVLHYHVSLDHSAVLSASLLVLWPLLPESGRWLLAQGRKEEAMKVGRMERGGRATR